MKTKDGTANYENREMVKRHDDTHAPKHSEPDGDEGAGEEDMQDVVAEHGPAESMEITTHHGDGHKHKSKHHDAAAAHDHVQKAFGEEAEEHEPAANEPMSAPMHSIPGMS